MAIEPKKYETLYLVRPDISPEDLLTIQNRVEKSVAGNGGEMIKSEKWAERDLAYRIDNYTRGTYYIAIYSAESEAVTDIERYFNLSKNNVLRFMTVQYIEEQKPAGAARSAPPQTSQQEDQSAFQTPSISEEQPQASTSPYSIKRTFTQFPKISIMFFSVAPDFKAVTSGAKDQDRRQ
jgi:small subunit ribosomal protein S6